VIAEHRLEEILPVCSKVVFMERGRVVLNTGPRRIGSAMKKIGSDMAAALPACVRIYAEFRDGETPVSVKETKQWLEQHARPKTERKEEQADSTGGEPSVILDDVWFRYEKKAGDVVKGVSLKVRKGTVYSVVGGNGVGKSTLLSVIGGVNRPYRGKVALLGRELGGIGRRERYRGLLGYLPQEPQNLFRRSTVQKDLEEMAAAVFPDRQAARSKLERTVAFFHLGPLLERHPYDLSGGEQQCAALAKVMLTEPEILLLDEPTKGIDAIFKERFSGLFTALKKAGKTIVLVSHDLDFCAGCSDDSALMFNGEIISEGATRKFFTGNGFYTTSANRIARGVFPDALTCEEVIRLCRNHLTGD
jgi:energy-coupling factor transport system ATP-binding protein